MASGKAAKATEVEAKEIVREDNKVILKIYDFEIKKDTLYEVKEKLDTSAPDGFREHNTTKVLSDIVVDTFPGAIFDNERKIWDTGLYPTSTALMRAISDSDARVIALKSLRDNILAPIEAEKGEGILDHTEKNNDFWDKFRIECHRGKLFDTSKTEDLLRLFLLLLHKRVTPKEMESHPEFKQPISLYCIVDKDSSVSREAEREMRKAKASALFYNLLHSDKDGLIQVLDYLGINAASTADDSILYTVFGNFISSKEDKFQNDKIFIETVERYQTEDGAEELYIHSKLKQLYVKGKVKHKKGEVWMDDVYVENGWKNAARKVKEDPEMKQIFASLLD
jgi:hypothetical protein